MKKRGKLAAVSSIAFTYVGTVVGAGFASGQEIISFFTVFGRNSIWAIMISIFLFIFMGTRILLLGMDLKASSFKKLIENTFGFLYPLVNVYLLFTMMAINVAMLAGAGAMFEEFGNTSYMVGVTITAFAAIVIIAFGIKGILSINKIVVVAILSLQIVVLFFTLSTKVSLGNPLGFIEEKLPNILMKGISYGSFNLILCTGVLAHLGNEFQDRNVLKLGGILGGIILGVMLLSTHYCLLANMPHIFEYEIPMLYIVSQLGVKGGTEWSIFLSIVYVLILWGGIFTTLIGNLFAMTSFFHERYRIRQLFSATAIICLAIVLSPLGFSAIVKNLYPLLGFIGAIFIIAILIR